MNRQELIAALFETMDVSKRSMHGHMQSVLRGFTISHTQLQLLFTIFQDQPITAKDIAQKLQLTPGAVSQVLEELDKQAFIERETDPTDRRRVAIRVSPTGNEILKALDKRRKEIMQRVIKDLSDEELATWVKIQRKIISEFQRLHNQETTDK